MSLSSAIKLYLLTVPLFLVIDMLWLGFFANTFYQQNLGHLLAPQVNWLAAVLFYLLYVGGIVIWAVLPGVREASLRRTLWLAAVFGFFTYATYDLTNWATLPGWPVQVVIIDILWGTVLCPLVAAGSFLIARRLS